MKEVVAGKATARSDPPQATLEAGIRIVDEKRVAECATYDVIAFDDVDQRALRAIEVAAGQECFLSPLAPFSAGKKHWLTIEYGWTRTTSGISGSPSGRPGSMSKS